MPMPMLTIAAPTRIPAMPPSGPLRDPGNARPGLMRPAGWAWHGVPCTSTTQPGVTDKRKTHIKILFKSLRMIG